MLHTPLHDWHAAHGGRMVDFAGWHMPVQYTSITEEHGAVRNDVGVFDISHMGRLRFDGEDACRFLDRLLTNHVEAVKPGRIRYSLVCNQDGGILDDVLIYRLTDEYLLVVNASNREKLLAWIKDHETGFDVACRDTTADTCMIAVQGPRAVEILAPLVSVDLTAMKYYTSVETGIEGEAALISRTGYTGEDGFEIIVDASQGPPLWQKLVDAGARPCGLGCRDTLRLEAAMPLYGHELDESIDPLTAGLAFGVKLDAADFIGRDALLAVRDNPTGRERVGLMLAGKRIAREGAELVSKSGEPVGTVTSGTFSPTLAKSIAMGYIQQSYARPGTEIEVDIRGKREPATLVPLPFYKRESPPS